MKITETLRKTNRTLLEMHLGILFCGVLCQAVGSFIVRDQALYARSLWFGILLAAAGAIHMYRSIHNALGTEKDAVKLVFRGYMIRYVLIVAILLIIIKTEIMNPLIVFMAYMSLKVTALIQPLTHKLCNKIFHETDPAPQPLPPEDVPDDDGDRREVSEERENG